MFLTDIVTVQSGQEYRNAAWSQARWKGEVRVPAAEMETKGRILLAFFRAVGGGRANKFRVRDWSDYDVKNSEGVFTTIDSTHFQAWKRYDSGSSFHERKITRLRATPTITVGSVTTPSWDLDTGILTVASGTPTHWTGIFDVPARFDTDNMDWHVVGRNANGPIIEWQSLPMIEVRE
jgi:uncharacterized protein (TIGR02217 family)